MATGGAYILFFGQTALIAAVMIILAFRSGKVSQAESDGCLLAITNLILTIAGAGIGFFIAPYPYFVVTSFFGAMLLPAIAILIFSRRYPRR
jgi:hypothetical protein